MEDYQCWNKHGEEGLNEAESRDSYVEREVVHSVVEEEDDDVDEADILGLSNADIMEQVVLKPGPIIKLTIRIIRSC
jgi:hypothetical protein